MSEADPALDGDLDEFLGQETRPPRTRLRRWLIAAAVVVLAIALVAFLTRGGEAGPQFATAEVRRGDMTVKVNATGNLAPTNEVSVGSELSGLVDRVLVDVNDRVARGQPLAQINTRNQLDQIRRSQASIAQARAQVSQAEASVRLSQAALARQEEVYRLSGGKVPSRADLDTARAQYQRDVAALASSRAQVNSAQAQLATDQTNLAKATIRSPVTGVILSREVEPGQTVAASFNAPVLFVIAEDLSAMELEVKVDEADVGQVRDGQPATFTVDAYPGKTFQARIVRVNVGSNASATSAAASGTGGSSVVSYGAVLAVANPDLALRPGMTATADIVTSRQANVLTVPNGALRFKPRDPDAEDDGGFMMMGGRAPSGEQEPEIARGAVRTIYILGADNSPQPITVRVGDTDGSRTIVTGDKLRPGMKVITGELATAE